MTTAIRAEQLAKKYLIANRPLRRNDMLREELASLVRGLGRGRSAVEFDEFWALQDVSFEIKQGSRVGLIGRNGAGKSTLLKILSRITEPTNGSVAIRGRVASLLEVGTGFHPELTGRENVYLNGAILGMRREEVRRKFDAIVAFAEVEQFLDTPVKRYSSGMYVRLAFAVAAHLEPDILIVDEVLAVGDAAFQKKCLAQMGNAAQQGTTVLFVSHNIAVIQASCDTAILLDAGKLIAHSAVGPVVRQYLDQSELLVKIPLAERTDRQGSGAIRFVSFEPRDGHDRLAASYHSGQHVKLLFRFSRVADRALSNAVFTVVVENELGVRVAYLSNEIESASFSRVEAAVGGIEIEIDKLPLLPGVYRFNLQCSINGEDADSIQNAGHVTVEAGDFFGTGRLPPVANPGQVLVQHRFHLRG
jgi:lipopolysaccharide transport system ATP-binding protein